MYSIKFWNIYKWVANWRDLSKLNTGKTELFNSLSSTRTLKRILHHDKLLEYKQDKGTDCTETQVEELLTKQFKNKYANTVNVA